MASYNDGLLWNAHGPYLRLAHPLEHIIITPLRLEDADSIVPILNDERVWRNLLSTPVPYTLADAQAWIKSRHTPNSEAVEQLKAGQEIVAICPLRIIRDERTDAYLGDCSIVRSPYFEISDESERQRLIRENQAKPAGDESIQWEFGGGLPSYSRSRICLTPAFKIFSIPIIMGKES